MPTDISHLDVQVNESIKKIDSYVKNPMGIGSLDAELSELLDRLNKATGEINDPVLLQAHNQRLEKLNQKISEYQRKKDEVTRVTRSHLAMSETPPEGMTLVLLKKSLEEEIANPLTVEELKKLLDKLSGKEGDTRKIIISYLWSKLANAGYIMTTQNGKVSLQFGTDQKNAEALEATINSYISSGKVNLSEFQRALLVGSGSFGTFVETQTANINAVTAQKYAEFLAASYRFDISKGSPSSKAALINASAATVDEKAFLISFVNGGYANYDLAPDAKRQLELKQVGAAIVQSPAYSHVQKVTDKVSGGAAAAEREKIQSGGKKEELTFDSFMNNPTKAISAYPWTSIALVAASIWKFGFGKTFFGLFAGILGIKALNELGNTELGKEFKDSLKKGTNDAVDAAKGAIGGTAAAAAVPKPNPAPAPAAVPTNTFDTKGLSDSQRKGVDSVQNNKSLTEDIQNFSKKAGKQAQNADLNTYLAVLHKDSIQNITLDKIIYTADFDQSVFSDEVKSQLPNNGDIPDNASRYLLKRAIRSYIGINSPLSPSGGSKKEGQDTLDEFKKKYPEDAWKTKTLKDIINEIHT